MRTRQRETTEMLEQKKTNSKTPVGPTKDRASNTNQHYPKLNLKFTSLYAGTIIESEA